jgi:hypothetical protein
MLPDHVRLFMLEAAPMKLLSDAFRSRAFINKYNVTREPADLPRIATFYQQFRALRSYESCDKGAMFSTLTQNARLTEQPVSDASSVADKSDHYRPRANAQCLITLPGQKLRTNTDYFISLMFTIIALSDKGRHPDSCLM